MKNLLLLCSVLFFSFSCSEQKEIPLTFEEKLQGEWLTYSFVINCEDASLNTPFTMAGEDGCINFWGEDQCISINFRSNGKAQIKNSSDVFTEPQFSDLTYTTDEVKQTIELCFTTGGCFDLALVDDLLVNEMDEDDCLCVFEYDRKD